MRIVDASARTLPAPGFDVEQDGVLVCGAPSLVAAVDGIGGPGRADRAARLVLAGLERRAPLIEKLARATERDRTSAGRLALVKALERAIGDIHAELAGMHEPQLGASLAVAVFTPGYALVAHVGAVRAYLLRDGRLRALTEDHTLGMARVRSGSMTLDEYRTSPLRRRLYQAVGTGADVDADVASVVLADRDVLLLCTDGVHAVLDDATVQECLAGGTADEAARALCEAARAAGSGDAASAVVVRIASEAAPEEIDALAHTLASTSLFRDLSESERLLVAPYLDRIDLENGDQLFAEGDPGDAFYVIVDGHVRVTRGGTPLTEIGPGGGFGELCLAGPRIARSASVTAVGPAVVLGLTRDRFHEVVARRPAIGTRLLQRSLDMIGERLRDLTERLAQVEGLAVGEIRPGDLALRTAIVLAARGEWPPEPTAEVERPPGPGDDRAAGGARNTPPVDPVPDDEPPELVPPPMPTARQRRRIPTSVTPVSPERRVAPRPVPDGQREPTRPLDGPEPQRTAQREPSRPLHPRPAPGSQREPTGPVAAPEAPPQDVDLAPMPLGDLPPIAEATVALPELPPGAVTGDEDTVLNQVVRRPLGPPPSGPPLAKLKRPMYRPDGEPEAIDPADIRIDLDDLGSDEDG